MDQRSIDLEVIRLELPQVRKRREPRAEVVDRDAAAQAAELVDQALHAGQVVDSAAFGYFEHDAGRVDVVLHELVGDVRGQLRVGE